MLSKYKFVNLTIRTICVNYIARLVIKCYIYKNNKISHGLGFYCIYRWSALAVVYIFLWQLNRWQLLRFRYTYSLAKFILLSIDFTTIK